jgi:hypothetical protein
MAASHRGPYRPKSGTGPLRIRRACIRCEKPFWSEGAHHRMCGHCRKDSDSGESDAAYVGPSVSAAWRKAGVG